MSGTARWGRIALAVTVATALASAVVGMTLAVKVLALFALALTLVAPWRPGVGLLGAGLLAALDAFARVLVFKGGLLPWNTFSYALLFVFLALLPRELPRAAGAPFRLGAVFAALLLLELVVSLQRVEGLQHVFGLFAFFAFALLASRAAPDRDAWLWLGVVAGTAGALFSLAFLAFGSPWERINKNAWAYAPLTGLLATCPAIAMSGERRARRLALTLLAAGDAASVFLSGSRGTFLVALGAMAWVLLAGADTPAQRLARLAAALLVAGPVALGIVVAFPEKTLGMEERLGALTDPSRTLANRTSGRSELARIGWEIAKEQPLGIGTGSFSAESGDFGSREALAVFHGGRELEAHSAWVKTLAENGYPGLLLLLAFVLSFAATGWARRAQGVLGLGLLASLVLGVAFLSTEFQPKGIWLFAAIAALALERGRVRRGEAAPAPLAAWPPQRAA